LGKGQSLMAADQCLALRIAKCHLCDQVGNGATARSSGWE
jgi:hypothetical protein